MVIDFTPLRERKLKAGEFSAHYTLADIRETAVAGIAFMRELIADLDDADVTFDPVDPEANDPYARAGEEHIGWSIAHLIVHVTASTEEGAALTSVLARGISYPNEVRLRYETDWRTVTKKSQLEQRLDESLRMRLAFLDSMPDKPLLATVKRSDRFVELFGETDYKATYIFSLMHEFGHHAQMLEVKRQAIEGRKAAAAR
ncbi:MAG: DinB family protein [Chloroflexi bacterium]|nr:DinB family protein [Chloroflexota bacterium]